MKIIYLLLLMLIIAPVSSWSMPTSLIKTDDGYVIAGLSGLSYGLSNACVIKVDKNGNEIWNKTYVGDNFSHARHIIEINEGYLIGGYTGFNDVHPWLVMIDKFGEVVWEKKFIEFIGGVTGISSDGMDILAVLTIYNANESGNTDTFLIKLHKDGKEIWREKIDYEEYDSIKMLRRASNGYIGAGYVVDYPDEEDNYFGDINYIIWVLKLKENGEIEWSKFYDLGKDEMAWDVVEVKDGYMVVGEITEEMRGCGCGGCDGSTVAFAIKLDRNGEIKLKRFFDAGKMSAWSVIADDEEIIAGGGKDAEGEFLWVSKINSDPIILRKNFKFEESIYGVVRMLKEDDGYLLTSSGCKGECIWLGKMSKNGELIWEKSYKPNAIFDISSALETQAGRNESKTPEVSSTPEDNQEKTYSNENIQQIRDLGISKELLYAILLIFLALILAFGVSKLQP
ncbi:MAG: hypothetical protein QXI54_06420 [Archaeoglobaceae archaeon]